MSITKIFILTLLSSFTLFGCYEKIPSGLTLKPTTIAKDTSYIIANIPAPQQKNVLMEEFTGVTCSNCPEITEKIKQMQSTYNPRLLVVKIHNNLQAKPIKITDPDLRCTDADALNTALGSGPKPSSGIDRLLFSPNVYWFRFNYFISNVNSQLTKTTPININLTTTLNTTKDSITLDANLVFTAVSNDKYMYHIYVLENDVEATQDSFDVATLLKIEIDGYKHEEVLRQSITPVFVGTALPDSSQVPGRVYRKIIQFAKPSNMINIDNGEVVFFITDAVTKEIIHSQHIKL